MNTINLPRCENCGTPRDTNGQFCGNCGNPFGTSGISYSSPHLGSKPLTPTLEAFPIPTPPPQAMKKKNVPAFLVLLLIVGSVIAGIFIGKDMLRATTNHPSPIPNPTDIALATSTSAATPTATPTPTPAPTPTPTPTSTPVVTLPCIVNADAWSNSSSWVAHNGILYNDGTKDTFIIAPCQIGTPNYVVEAKIEMTKQPVSGGFGIFFHRAPGPNGWREYKTGVQTNGPCNYGRLAFIGDHTKDCGTLAKIGFTVDTSMHTYRAEVKDNIIRFFIDGGLVLTTTDNRLLTTQGDQAVGIYDDYNQIQVSSFKVTALS